MKTFIILINILLVIGVISCILTACKIDKKMKAGNILWDTMSRRTPEIERATGRKVLLYNLEDIKESILCNIKYGKEIIDEFIEFIKKNPDYDTLNPNVSNYNPTIIEKELRDYLKELKN